VSGNGGAFLLTAVAGVAAALQASINAALGRRIGTLEAATFQTIVAVIIFVGLTLAARQTVGGVADALREPAWLWLSGVMGVIIITSLTFAPNRIGVLAFAAILIAGQLITSIFIDHYGLFGLERIGFTWERALGLALLAGGAFLVLRR
jgi:transporter family-2 protein